MALGPQEIYSEAQAAGFAAANSHNSLPPDAARGFDCGMAWVTIKPARGAFVKWCRENKKGDNGCHGGWVFWYSEFDNANTQSVSVHEASAEAFAAVLNKHGIKAEAGSRLD